jgi:hypothetical protein
MEIVKIQTEVMINLKEDLNTGFAETYKQIHQISDPVVVAQLNEE